MTTAQQDLTSVVGDRLTESWRAAFTATPRELFIPDRALWVRGGDVKIPIDRDDDPETWMRAVYSNDAPTGASPGSNRPPARAAGT
jgi:hypothetical protein